MRVCVCVCVCVYGWMDGGENVNFSLAVRCVVLKDAHCEVRKRLHWLCS